MNPLISTRPGRARLTQALLALTLALAATASLSAATLTVSKLGGAAYTNIQDAINAALPEDTVFVEQGEYKESLSVTKNLTIKGADPRYTLIRPASGPGVDVDSNVRITITGVWITASGSHGIQMREGSNVWVENCIISSCAGRGVTSLTNGATAFLTVFNCTIALNVSYAVYFYGPNSPGYTVWTRNIFYRNGAAPYSYYGATYSYNCVNETNPAALSPTDITSNPMFQDAAGGNFLLQTGSPCINAGNPGPAFRDPDGTRNDMGAFGGPGAAEFWPYPPGGPFITELQLREGKVTQGAKLKIHAVGQAR